MSGLIAAAQLAAADKRRVEEVVKEEGVVGLIPPKANGMPVFIWAPDKGALIHRGEWMLKGRVPLISKLYNRSPGLTAQPPRRAQ